jgi:glycyl-tRNA synthetase beta chain
MNRLLLEIGTEEIPAGYIQPALDALAHNMTRKLEQARITHQAVTTFGTPRRLVISIDQVADRQQAVTETVVGPPERIAYDEGGNLTVPALKFAEKLNVSPDRLRIADTKKGRYLSVTITDRGAAARTILKQILPDVISAIPFPKTMRWSDLNFLFARPIQSLVALLGKAVISFKLDDRLKSGRYSWGHLFMHHKRIKIEHADHYLELMRQAHVIVDFDERRQMVQKEIDTTAAALGGRILPDEALLDTVTNLVEIPVATGGHFDDIFLELPKEILITAMREHQKYFAVVDDSGQLMSCFVAVNNTRTKDAALVAKGHERVLRARLSDARFFYRTDLKDSMDRWSDKLKGVLFQAKLGSMQEKVQRVQSIASHLADAASPQNKAWVVRAAQLCKSDLVSQVVGEFAKLQGVMGRIYAAAAGEVEGVAAAIEEHYRPTHSGGELPETTTGALLAIADKLDTICGCFQIGLIPTGASDPYALRRQAIGIVQIMLAHQLTFSLNDAIVRSLEQFKPENPASVAAQIQGFFRNRIARLLADEAYTKDTIAAVVDVSIDHIPDVWQRAAALQALRGAADFEPLAVAFKRAVNLLRKTGLGQEIRLDPLLFQDPAEKNLFEAYQTVKEKMDHALGSSDYKLALQTIATLRMPVDQFFDGVMVMTEDMELRRNRLALLQVIADLFNHIADFSKIAT